MEKIIEVNSVKYIRHSEYKKLEKKKEKIVKGEINLNDYTISDPSNVCAIYPLKKNSGEFKELETTICFYKRIEKPKIISYWNEHFEVEVIKIKESKYSKDYFDNIKKMASVWFSDKPEIFMAYNKEEKEFVKDQPIMFVFDWSIAFILAPRMEVEDDELEELLNR